MSIQEDIVILEADIEATLNAFRVSYTKTHIVKDVSIQFVIEAFGTVVCGINRADYSLINNEMLKVFDGWRIVYVTTFDSMNEKKEEILWELMKSGYMTYIRSKFKRQFNEIIIMHDFGKKIINQRLKIWGDVPKYKWLVEENTAAKKESATYVLSINPGFYDYMPEE
jgi:hypothetical protein